MVFITNKERFWSSIKRLFNHRDDGVMFWNHDKTFKMMIRIDPDGSTGKYVTFELVILDHDPRIGKVLEKMVCNFSGNDDTDEYVVDQWEFDKNDLDQEELDDMIQYINTMYEYVFCHCGEHFIKDSIINKKDMCVFCEMTATDDDMQRFECPVCLEIGYEMHSKTVKCCDNKLHAVCYDRWAKEGNGKCMFCREDLPKEINLESQFDFEDVVSSIADAVEQRLNSISSLSPTPVTTSPPQTP